MGGCLHFFGGRGIHCSVGLNLFWLYSGIFTLYALLHEPDLFLRYLIGSAIFENMLPYYLAYEQQLASQRTSLPVHAFFSAGELEEDVVPAFHQFIDTLKRRNYEGLRLETFIDAGEGHLSTGPTAFCKGLKAIYHA
jgi:hypothetical protein